MPKDLDIELKEYIRQYFRMKMEQARGTSKHFGVSAGIIIRDVAQEADLEDFLDELWVFITKKNQLKQICMDIKYLKKG